MSMREELAKLRAEHAKLLAKRIAQIYTADQLALLVDREKDIKALLKGMEFCDPERRAKVQNTASPNFAVSKPTPVPAPAVNPATMAAAMTQGW